MFKNISKYVWFSFIPFMILGALTIGLLAAKIIPVAYLLVTFIMWTLVSGVGIACGYHRIFSHKCLDLPKWKENIVLFFGALAGQGSSITWTAIHRGYHHRKTDTLEDIHSPVHKGILWSFVVWTNSVTENSNVINMKYAVDLLRKPNHLWFHKHHFKLLWLPFISASLIDWKLALCMFALPTCISLFQDNLTNVLGHKKAIIGYRNFSTADNSFNNLILGYLGWGQGWHNNHHHNPSSFDFGTAVSGNCWEFDPCKLLLPFLGKLNK
jgi:stearoyl-CoA desaturase (delta-9 desaturase)